MEKAIYKVFNETDGMEYLVRADSGSEAEARAQGRSQEGDKLTSYMVMSDYQQIASM